jgi:hypothetical protein
MTSAYVSTLGRAWSRVADAIKPAKGLHALSAAILCRCAAQCPKQAPGLVTLAARQRSAPSSAIQACDVKTDCKLKLA